MDALKKPARMGIWHYQAVVSLSTSLKYKSLVSCYYDNASSLRGRTEKCLSLHVSADHSLECIEACAYSPQCGNEMPDFCDDLALRIMEELCF